MKSLSILMAVLTGAVPAVATAAATGGMLAAIGPSCGAGSGCISTGAFGQPGAMTAVGPGPTEVAQAAGASAQMVAAAIPGGGQGAAGAGSIGGMPGGSAATGTGPDGGPTGVNIGGSPGGANNSISGIGSGPGGAMGQPVSPGGDNRNLFNRHIDRAPGSASSASQPSVSESDAARHVQQSTGGRILNVKPDDVQGRLTYRVKVLTDSGEVRVITIDAQTGAQE